VTGGVHPTAVIDPRAELGADVVVGPYAVVGPGVEVGESTEIQAHAIIERDTRIGRGCLLGYGAVVGAAPQDVTFHGGPSRVEIGDGTRIREYSTVHRATRPDGVTRIGAGCFLMSYVHVAHDCEIGDEVVMANAVQLAGHVRVDHHAWIGGQTPVHQFVRIGEHAFVGGGSRVPQDVPPFARVAGIPLKLYGVNVVGLRRAGFAAEIRLALQHAFRQLFHSERTVSQAVAALRAEPQPPEVHRLLDFISTSERGVLVGG
jgi:UDP-N-acetylglucosamine acyltransferase